MEKKLKYPSSPFRIAVAITQNTFHFLSANTHTPDKNDKEEKSTRKLFSEWKKVFLFVVRLFFVTLPKKWKETRKEIKE